MRLNRPLFPDPLLAEAIGALEVTCFGLKLSLNKVILKGDSQQIIHDITKEDGSWSLVEMVVGDIKTKLMQEWAALRVRRNSNKAAHALAQNALFSII